MAKHGKFIANKFMNQKVELFIDLDSEWLSYADGDAQSYTILKAIPVEYDESSGILTLKNDKGQVFYVGEEFIKMFWLESTKFRLNENTTSSMHPARKTKKDIM